MAITLAANSAMVRSSGSNPTVNYDFAPTVNSGLAVFSAIFGTTVTAVSDNQGNTYTQRQASSTNLYAHTARAATSSGTVTVTVTSGGGDHQIVVANWDGTDTAADPYDVGNNASAVAANASVTTSATTTVTPTAVIGAFSHVNATTTITPTDTQVEEEEDAGSGMPINVQWRRDTGATGTKASAWTHASVDYRAVVITFKEGAGAAPASLPPVPASRSYAHLVVR